MSKYVQQIRCINSTEGNLARICDIEIENDEKILVFKERGNWKRIPLQDFWYQIERAQEEARKTNKKLP